MSFLKEYITDVADRLRHHRTPQEPVHEAPLPPPAPVVVEAMHINPSVAQAGGAGKTGDQGRRVLTAAQGLIGHVRPMSCLLYFPDEDGLMDLEIYVFNRVNYDAAAVGEIVKNEEGEGSQDTTFPPIEFGIYELLEARARFEFYRKPQLQFMP